MSNQKQLYKNSRFQSALFDKPGKPKNNSEVGALVTIDFLPETTAGGYQMSTEICYQSSSKNNHEKQKTATTFGMQDEELYGGD